jgi:hypothetical protein
MRVRGDGHNALSIAFPNGSRIVGLPENETTIRGFSDVSLLLIDEASRVADEIYRAMRPTLVVHEGDLWLMSTPNGRRGFFWDEWERISVPATECPRISERVLAEEKATAGKRWYRQGAMFSLIRIIRALRFEAKVKGKSKVKRQARTVAAGEVWGVARWRSWRTGWASLGCERGIIGRG